jgi:excisionase family DNA binding protein
MSTETVKNQWIDTSIDPNFFKNKNLSLYINTKRGKWQTMSDIDLLTSEELLKVLKISGGTLHAMIKSNEIPHFYMGKKVLRFNKKSIMEWLQKLEDDIHGGAAS